MRRWLIVLLGILLGQVVLYGPSLVGSKILLPLDILALPGYYIPKTAETARIIPHNRTQADLIDTGEPLRRFAGREIRAGRVPRWNPYQYAGAPYAVPKLSPFGLLGACFESPRVIPWVQMLAALVAGSGAYVFCRRMLSVAFWPAAIVAWCYPLTAFFVLWQGFPVTYSAVWLPWMLIAVHRAVRRADVLSAATLAVTTGLALLSGQFDVAGQVLLASGLYALWCLWGAFYKQWFSRRALAAVVSLVVGWTLGFLFAAPDLLPAVEYSRTGARMVERSAGAEDRPPVGWAALPQIVLPTLYGTNEVGSYPCFPKGQRYLVESTATGYAGILATLLVAPLAWNNRKRRPAILFFVALGFLALSWSLDVPGLTWLLRRPGLNMMSHNRFVFVTAFSILALTALGLDALERGMVKRRWWFWIPATVFGGLLAWCLFRAVFPPEPLASELAAAVGQGKRMWWITTLDGVMDAQSWYLQACFFNATLCMIGLAGWLLLWRETPWKPQGFALLGALLMGELLWFGCGRSSQCDPALYYPRIPALEAVAKAAPGRVVGNACTPAMLLSMHGLRDIRGYDAVDPARLMDLMRLAASKRLPTTGNAWTQFYSPQIEFAPPDVLRLSPVLDMLNVRYVILRGTPPEGIRAAFQSPDYWVLENHNSMPRAFVPRRVETVMDSSDRLAKLGTPEFDARAVAYVESPVALADACRGEVRIENEIPSRITLSAQMETQGLVVLSDLWDAGWRAFVDGNPVSILRANHAVRGVVVPAGDHTLEFRYEPASVAWGWRLAGLGLASLTAATGVAAWRRRLRHN